MERLARLGKALLGVAWRGSALPGRQGAVSQEAAFSARMASAVVDNGTLPFLARAAGSWAGAANFSASGNKRQDNDLIVIEGTEATAAFREIRYCPIGQDFPPVMGVAVTGWIALKASPFSVGRCKQN
jgi:hypothetical protein